MGIDHKNTYKYYVKYYEVWDFHSSEYKSTIFWDAMLYSMFDPRDGGKTFSWNTSKLLPDYTALQCLSDENYYKQDDSMKLRSCIQQVSYSKTLC
jgi:hypothetical protein